MSLSKEKHREYMKLRSKEDDKRKARNKAAVERRKQIKLWFAEYKSKLKCSKCGQNPHPVAMDFHHPNHDNEVDLYKLKLRFDKAKIIEEISRCIPVCANCHRIIHWEERQTGE